MTREEELRGRIVRTVGVLGLEDLELMDYLMSDLDRAERAVMKVSGGRARACRMPRN